MGLLHLKHLFAQPKLSLSLKLSDSKPGPYFGQYMGQVQQLRFILARLKHLINFIVN